MTRNPKLFAAVMSVGMLSVPCAVRAQVTLFQDNFSNDTDVFSYPDVSNSHLPGATSSGLGSWIVNDAQPWEIQAGVITNTLPGGGTGGADGNTHYMALERNSSPGNAIAVFSNPAGTSGNLSVQFDMYDIGPGTNFSISLSDQTVLSGQQQGPYVLSSYFPTGSGPVMALAPRVYPNATYDQVETGATGSFTTTAWVHMDMEVNLSEQTYQLYVDGILAHANPDQGVDGGYAFTYYNAPGTVKPFESLLFNGASAAGESIYVDNVVVTDTAAGPATLTWDNADANGLWDTGLNLNWNDGTANSLFNTGDNVTLNDNNGGVANYAVTLNNTVAPGSVIINNSNGNYTISGTGGISGSGSLTKSGTGTATLSTANSYSGGTNVTGGTLIVAANGALPSNEAVSLSLGGNLQLATNTGGETVSALSITGGSTLDLTNNHIVVNYGAAGNQASVDSAIRGYITSGSILSSMANGSYGVGYADGNDGSEAGIVAPNTVLISYALFGDVNLDGVVNGTDFGLFAVHFGQAVSSWDLGDFNYDGVVNGTDFGLLAANFGDSASGADIVLPSSDWAALDSFAAANGLLADVPEPASVGVILSAAIGFLGFRVRRSVSSADMGR
jgi:fibronectin-binding autotransporter adhesin